MRKHEELTQSLPNPKHMVPERLLKGVGTANVNSPTGVEVSPAARVAVLAR